jgi:mRNA interferase MazF
MAVTSQIKQPLEFGEMLVTEWATAGLLKPSVIKPIITTIEKSLVLKNLGYLHPKDSRELLNLLPLIVGTKTR